MTIEKGSPEYRTKEYKAQAADLRSRRVAAAKQWQPLLQALVDSGVAAMIEEQTGKKMLELEIISRAESGVWTGSDPIVEGEEDINFAKATQGTSSEFSREWSIGIAPTFRFGPTLPLQTTCYPDGTSTEEYAFLGHQHKVSFEIDQNRNLRIVGSEETFKGPIDHLSQRGRSRVRAALNRAFRRPAISSEPLSAPKTQNFKKLF